MMVRERDLRDLFGKIFAKQTVRGHQTEEYLIRLSFVLASYLFAGAVGLAVPFTNGNVSPVWPASGVALAATIVFGYRIWPAVAVGAFLVNFFTPIPGVAALGIAVGNTLGAVAGGWFLRRVGFQPALARFRDVMALIVFAALGASAISATLGTVVLSVTPVNPWSNFGVAWLMWYLGDALGVLTVTPLLLTIASLKNVRKPPQVMNLVTILLGTVVCSLLIFDDRIGFETREDLFAFAVFPFVIWGAIRFEAIGAAAVTFLIAIIVVLETAYGWGPFAKSSPLQNAELLQVFLGVISISGMMLAAVNTERVQIVRQQAGRERVEAERRAALELEIARQVQINLLPQRAPALSTLDYAATSVQARIVGGDYYDYFDLGQGRVAFILADISGKGISAALLMANLQAALRSQSAVMAQDLRQSLRTVNHMFYESTESRNFATVFVGVYDDSTRRLSYVNCGHNPPLLVRADTTQRLAATATILGAFPCWECEVGDVELAHDDILAIYSDGIVEGTNRNEKEFGETGLENALRKNLHLDAQSLLSSVICDVQQFTSGEQGDDQTLLVVRVN